MYPKVKKFFLEFELFNRHPLSYLAVFLVALILSSFFQASPHFADPDSFYHVKISLLTSELGPLNSLPWLSATSLAGQFTDHHLLYHVALIPFVKFFPPLVGMKIASILFASLVIVVFYWLLQRFNVIGAFWFTLLLLAANSFVFRINLAKAQNLAFIFLFIYLYLLLKQKWPWLLALSWIYVWLYGGWPILLLLSLIYSAVMVFVNRDSQSLQRAIKALGLTFLGLAAGLIINPYFPQNVNFYLTQIWEIAVINYKSTIGVGGEWYGYKPLNLLSNISLVFSTMIVALVFFPTVRQAKDIKWFLFVVMIVFYILTLKSRRNVEYFVPFAIFWAGWVISQAIKEKRFAGEFELLAEFFGKYKLASMLAVVFLAMSVPYIITRDVYTISTQYHHSFNFDKFKEASAWLEHNSKPQTIVFHSDWDEFPILFYHNHHNYYLVGLDPTFLFQTNPDKYWDWQQVTTGGATERLYDIISQSFNADYVFIDRLGHQAMQQNIENNFHFKRVFQNQESAVYQVL